MLRSIFWAPFACVFLSFPAVGHDFVLKDFRDRQVYEFEQYLETNGLTLLIQPRVSTLSIGSIIEHVPAAGGMPGVDGKVVAFVSGGATVPNELIGRPIDEVRRLLGDAGLEYQVTSRPLRLPSGVVGAIFPGEGAEIDATIEAVTIVVSSRQIVRIPSVTGLTFAEARKKLQADGFVPSGEIGSIFIPEGSCPLTVTVEYDAIDRTVPPAHEFALHGSTVKLLGVTETVSPHDDPHCPCFNSPNSANIGTGKKLGRFDWFYGRGCTGAPV